MFLIKAPVIVKPWSSILQDPQFSTSTHQDIIIIGPPSKYQHLQLEAGSSNTDVLSAGSS